MPRFGLDQSPREVERYNPGTTSSLPSPLLTCLSPDGRSIHLLHSNRIETHALPLAGTSEDATRVPVISTKLPPYVDHDGVVELVCVEGDSMPLPVVREGHSKLLLLPLLCVYTRHAVFLLKIGYSDDADSERDEIEGEILELKQPFEGYLYPSSNVIRVRPAPHRRLGYVPFEHPGSLAALVSHGDGEACLLLYHAKSQDVSEPLTFPASEAVFGEPEYTDFCFCQSNALTLLVSLSIHLVKSNGEVWGASPILFDGCMVPTDSFEKAYSLLEEYSLELDDAKKRQCRAAMYFLNESFVEQADDYMVARLHSGNPNRSTLWPVQLQGPLLEGGEMSSVATLEPFLARNLVGFAMAGAGGVQLCVTAPTMLLPLFALESRNYAPPCIKVVEQIPDLACTALVRDPVLDTVIHCITDRGVATLTSHALRHFSESLEDPAVPPPQATKGWMTVELTDDVGIQGAVVSGDAHLGHVMVVYMSTGHLSAINLTETRIRFEDLLQSPPTTNPPKKDEALQTMEATPAFHEQLGLIVDKIEAGLLGMSKMIGSATHPRDLDAGLLASALSVRQRCEQDLIVHLKYLRRMSAIRKSELKNVLKLQAAQLQAIQESLKVAKSKRNAIRERMVLSEAKSRQLAARCSSVLQDSIDLRPALTQADMQYFASLYRMKAQCDEWESKVGQLSHDARALDAAAAYDHVELEPNEARNIRTLLRGQMDLIAQANERVRATQDLLGELGQQSGVAGGGE